MRAGVSHRPSLLQLAPFLPSLEVGLAERYEVHRLFEITDSAAWLTEHGSSIVAVVTGGHLGVSNDVVDKLPRLQIVAINGVGVDKVDLKLARRRGYRVTNTPDVLTDDVADLAIGLAIALFRGVVSGHGLVTSNGWPTSEQPLGRKFSKSSFGILGLGRIGLAIAQRLEGFRAEIGYTDILDQDVPYTKYSSAVTLAAASDVLILATSATAENNKIINRPVFDALGPTGFLINVARGSLVDEECLISALNEGRIGGAALDVFRNEPHVPTALQKAPNVILTPHIASATIETREAMSRLVLSNLEAHFADRPLLTAVV